MKLTPDHTQVQTTRTAQMYVDLLVEEIEKTAKEMAKMSGSMDIGSQIRKLRKQLDRKLQELEQKYAAEL